MSRLAPLLSTQMSEEQHELFDDIIDSRGPSFINHNGSLQGPFDALLRSPALGDAMQKAGAQIRFNTTLSAQFREVAILVCAQHWQADYEWWVHNKLAISEGVDEQTLEAIHQGESPVESDFRLIQSFLTELNQTGKVTEKTYADALELLGEQGVVELTLLSGYYATISQLLNVFEIPLPDGEDTPFARKE